MCWCRRLDSRLPCRQLLRWLLLPCYPIVLVLLLGRRLLHTVPCLLLLLVLPSPPDGGGRLLQLARLAHAARHVPLAVQQPGGQLLQPIHLPLQLVYCGREQLGTQ